MLGLQYLWLLRMDTAFEEVAAEAGRVQAERVAALRAGRRLARRPKARRPSRRPRIPLAASGHPATAVLWKNVRALLSELGPLLLVIAVGTLLAVGGLVAAVSGSLANGVHAVLAMCPALVFAATLFGPRFIPFDWRRDLARVELLKTYPLGGFRLAAAEVATPVLALGAFQTLLLAVAAALLPFAGETVGAPRSTVLLAGVAAVVGLPLINGMLVAIHNALALLFPAWSTIGGERPGGVEHMGQAILTIAGTLALLAVAAVPPALLGGVVWLMLSRLRAVALALALGGEMALLLLGAELALVILALGWLYDRLDRAAAGLVQ